VNGDLSEAELCDREDDSDFSSLTTGRSQILHVVGEGIETLRSVLPDTTIIAALDIIYLIKYKTSLGRHLCEVLGIISTYTVFPHLDVASTAVSSYCACLSFAYAVLISENRLV